ncbi:MAG: metallopeptidase TldD-related protein [Terriglobales bacterium]
MTLPFPRTDRRWLRLAVLVVGLCWPGSMGAQGSGAAPALEDPILRAMSAELERSRDKLQLDQASRPYYIEYSVTDLDEYSADASFGALVLENRQRSRVLRAVVRVGNYDQDSYFGAGQGQVQFAVLGEDELALRHQLWLATDAAYKNAVASLSAKQALLKNLSVKQTVDDFSREPAQRAIDPLVKVEMDAASWRTRVRDLSRLFRQDPEIDSAVNFSWRGSNRYFINTEGTVSRRGYALYVLYFTGTTQAADGMRLTHSRDWVVARPEELPSPEVTTAAARKLIATLGELRRAPIVEDSYRGPVLFAADAAKMIFWNLIGPAITGDQPAPGDTARTTGEFASHYKTRVLPDFLSIEDDPTASSFRGRALVGSYDMDDEGAKARRVSVVERGVLMNYLMGRRPILDFPRSNGHGRAAPGASPVPSFSNLFVRSEQPLTFEQLKQKLIDQCRSMGRPYGYLVESTSNSLVPVVLYRIWVEDGREELVRGAAFAQLDARALRSDLIAAGDDAQADNSNEPIPKAVINPSVLFSELEVRRATQASEKLPSIPPPGLASAAP